jgi:hypothetical protein
MSVHTHDYLCLKCFIESDYDLKADNKQIDILSLLIEVAILVCLIVELLIK